MTAGSALFARLQALGIDYVFCNSGTDFPPIVEGLAEAAANDLPLPQTVIVPHEHAALGMAHGYYQATGRPQAVMLHTNVGLANGAIGAINAACEHVPILLMSGRTPVTERGRFGARTVPIGWGQEMRDQAALVREACKWDYELRFPEQIGELLDRAFAIAGSTPKGPVYLSLPREVLCEPVDRAAIVEGPATMQPALTAARIDDIRTLAQWITEAERPLIIAQRGSRSQLGFEALTGLVEAWAIPVCHYWAVAAAIPTDHPMNIGVDPTGWLEEADLVIVIDSLAPWQPDLHQPAPGARIVQLGCDPLFSRFPVRNFPSQLSISGETTPSIQTLSKVLASHHPRYFERLLERRARIAEVSAAERAIAEREAEAGCTAAMSKAWVSLCLSRAIERSGRRASVVSELGCPLRQLTVTHANGYRQEPHSGGLGYGLPAAMGIQLAEPATLVFATVGDGSYMFANPTACHQIAESLGLPIITLVLNNAAWGAVRQSVLGQYPGGHAARANRVPLTSLEPIPDFTLTAAASRAYAETVSDGSELPAALQRAIAIATDERRQVLLDIKIGVG